MRFSIEPNDPAYDPAQSQKVAKVTLNGAPVQMVLTADEELGYVKAFAADGEGRPIPVGDAWKVEEHQGKVVVELRKEERAWDTDRKVASKVAVGMHPNGDIELLVYSAVRPGALRRVLIPVHIQRGTDLQKVQQVGIYAGAQAEELCKAFNDTLDPEDVARVAIEQAIKAISEFNQANR